MKTILIICLLLITQLTYAQVDDIKKNADKHKDTPSDNNAKSPNKRNDNSLGESCLSSCFETCFQIFFTTAAEILIQHHDSLMRNRASDPTVLSFDVMPQFAYAPNNYYVDYLPRIRGTWGVLATDLRLNYLTEYKNNNALVYKTIDWQVINLNLMFTNNFNFRIGTGLMYDDYLDRAFNQHFVATHFRINDQKLLIDLEGRFTYDYQAKEPNVFNEVNVRANFNLLKTNHIWTYLMFGGVYQQYYSSVELWSIQAGLLFNIH